MREHDVAAMREMLVELHPRQRSAQQAGQRLLAHLERLAPQVVAVELQQIEGDENDVLVVATMPQHLKSRHPILVAAHRLAIDQAAAVGDACWPLTGASSACLRLDLFKLQFLYTES